MPGLRARCAKEANLCCWFRLKGGGWYETDFKSGKEKCRAATALPAVPAAGQAVIPAVNPLHHR